MEIESVTSDPVINVVLDTLRKKKQALIFVSSKRSAQKVALDIAKVLRKHSSNVDLSALKSLSETCLHAVSSPTEQCSKLAQAIECGVAFHHAGLASLQKKAIEDAFRSSTLQLIVCTPTLAAGLDMPAFRTILKDLKRFNGNWGMQYIPVLEYLQMAGRAGRPGKEDFGEAIAIANTEKERQQLIDTYINGQAEDIYSKLAVEPVLRMYVLSLLATGLCRTRNELMKFFSQSFWAHQYHDMPHIERIIERVIKLLVEYEFVEMSGSSQKQSGTVEFESAADIMESQEDRTFIVTPLGLRVSQLYLDPITAHTLVEGLKKQSLPEFGLIHLLCMSYEMRPLLRVKTKEVEDMNQFLFTHESELVNEIPTIYDPDYDDFFGALKTTQFFTDWISEKGEDYLLKQYDIRPGEVNAKVEIMDWLLYCCIELSKIIYQKQHVSLLTKMRTRVSYGVKEDVLALLQFKGVGRVRARQLVNKGVVSVGDMRKVPVATLASIIGDKLAISLKEQVGEKVDFVSKPKKAAVDLTSFV